MSFFSGEDHRCFKEYLKLFTFHNNHRSRYVTKRSKPKKRLPPGKIALSQPQQINKTWSIDFMSDAFISGKRFRTVNIIDDCNREVLGIKASISFRITGNYLWALGGELIRQINYDTNERKLSLKTRS